MLAQVLELAHLENLHSKLQLIMDLLAHNNNGLTLFADHLDNLDQLVHKELPDNLDQQEHLDLLVDPDLLEVLDHKDLRDQLVLPELEKVVEQKVKPVQLVQLV
jgi:hypothetical protein